MGKDKRMKSKTLFLRIMMVLFLLAGCGGSGDTGIPTGQPCTVDANCDDGVFCNGNEVCVQGGCVWTPRCDDFNTCTDNICSDLVDTCRFPCNATTSSDACCDNPACADDPVCAGYSYQLHVTALTQSPVSCVIPQSILDLILPIIIGTEFTVDFPPEGDYPTTIELPIPILGPVSVTANLVGGELVFDPVELEDIDLSGLGIPGLNCIVGGTVQGSTDGFGMDSMEVTIDVDEMSVETGTGAGACLLTEDPSPTCTMQVLSEGYMLEP